MDLNLLGFSVVNIESPSKRLPSPIIIKPKIGIKIPPINKPIALIESETATAFKPPKTAYIEPIIPIPQTHIQIDCVCVTPNNSGTSNMPLIAKEPEYKITGSKTTT